MEVHVPDQTVKGRRELLVHLGLITAGALIALSFEGIATWREHRALVREARANLLTEIRDNRKELDERLKKIPVEEDNITRALEVAVLLQQHKPIEGKFGLGFENADLQSASHTTAQATGAFALMEYEEVKKFAGVYKHQEFFSNTQAQATQDLMRAISGAALVSQSDPPSAREIEDWKAALRQTGATLLIAQQLGEQLVKEYDRVLAAPH